MKLGFGSFVLAAALSCTFPALAQDQGTPPQPQGGEQQGQPQGGAQGGDARPEGGQEGGRRRGGRRGGMMGLPVDRMAEELGLTPEQVTQLEALNDEMREKGREMMREAFQGGGDPGAAREKIRAMFEETWTKVDGFLTPEQKEKAKAFRAQLEERMRGGFMGGRGRGGDGEGFGGRGGRGNARARLKEDALKALALTEDEAAVVTPLLETVLETRELLMREGETRRQAFLEKARQTTDAAALTKALEEFRAAREADKAQASASMNQLREVLTVEQEAKLVGLGVLD